VKPNVPSKLDWPNWRLSWDYPDAFDLNDPLILCGIGLSWSSSERSPTVLEIFGEGVVQGSNLTLHIAVHLSRISESLLLSREESRIWERWWEPTHDICFWEGIPWVKSDLSFHTRHFVSGVKLLEVLKLGLWAQVRIPWTSSRSIHSHRTKDVVRYAGLGAQRFDSLHLHKGVITVPTSTIRLSSSCSSAIRAPGVALSCRSL